MKYIVEPDLKVQIIFSYTDETYRVNFTRVRSCINGKNVLYSHAQRIDVQVPNSQQTTDHLTHVIIARVSLMS